MNICDDNHKEIAHEGLYCPICNLIEDLENQISELEDKIINFFGEHTRSNNGN